jgi:hypothetical protein
MFELIATMKRGSSRGMPQAWARSSAVELARAGAAELLRDDCLLRVVVAGNEVSPAFVGWAER